MDNERKTAGVYIHISMENQARCMTNKNIETKEDLESFFKTNYEEYKNLIGKKENLWKQYNRSKSEEDKSKILNEINDIQKEKGNLSQL